ncbi:MAG: putative quinol monooxygenase [Paracoccaceae bacterium]
MYLVTVIFTATADKAGAFAARVQQQATDSLTEPGCQRFDVWTDPADPTRTFLYEIYDDRAAFDAHLASTHFKAFDAEVASWIVDKQVETWALSPG